MSITTERVRTRYGTRSYNRARCSVPGCDYRGPRREGASKARADEQRHYAERHPRPAAAEPEPAGRRFSFEVVPVADGRFEPFVLDVPSLSGHGAAARRAFWTAMHELSKQGVDFEEFLVYTFEGDVRGDRVSSAGVVPAGVLS